MLSQSNGNGHANGDLGSDPMPSRSRILPASEMSASQRNQTFDATIQQLNLVITQVNALTQQVNDLNHRSANTYTDLRATDDRHEAFVARTRWQRLRWLMVGR